MERTPKNRRSSIGKEDNFRGLEEVSLSGIKNLDENEKIILKYCCL